MTDYNDQTQKALQGWHFFTRMTTVSVVVATVILALMALFLL